jgi:hypothetical protein
MGGAGITIIPTSQNSPISFYISGDFNNRSYRDAFRDFNTNEWEIVSSLGYTVINSFRLRAGVSFESTDFVNDEDADKESYQIFSGFNLSLPGSNSLDLEFGHSFANYNFIDTSTIFTFPQALEEFNGDLKSFYISPRFSRPLGNRAGFNITYSYSEFTDEEDKVVYAYSSGFLSPWASVWAGKSVTVNLKAYPFREMIATAGFGYFTKTYLNSLELKYILHDRHDYQRSWYISLSWPMPSRMGLYIEPSLQVSFTNNSSTYRLYDYKNLTGVIGFTFRY